MSSLSPASSGLLSEFNGSLRQLVSSSEEYILEDDEKEDNEKMITVG